MKLVLLLGGLYLTCAANNLWFGGKGHDYNRHGEDTENKVSMLGRRSETSDEVIYEECGWLPYSGNAWCEKLMKCLNIFEEECEEEELDENGCLTSRGYEWCEWQNICLRPRDLEGDWEKVCVEETFAAKSVETNGEGSVVLGEISDENGCLGSAGYTWCEKQNKCVRSWELEGEWEDECGAEITASSYEGTIKLWVFTCILVLAVSTTLLLYLIRKRRMRKRRARSASIILAGCQENYAGFNSGTHNVIYQQTVADQGDTKDAVPSHKEFTNLV